MSSIACAFSAQADRQREHLFICLHQRTHTHTHTHNSQPLRVLCVCPLPQVIQHEKEKKKSQIQGEDNIFSLLFQSMRLYYRTCRQKPIIKLKSARLQNLHLTAFDLKVYLTHNAREVRRFTRPGAVDRVSVMRLMKKHVFSVLMDILRVLVPNLR